MNNQKEWHAISVTVPREGSDWISHLLFELGSIGNLEEEAPNPALIAMKGYFPVEVGPSQAIIQSILNLLDEKGIKPLSTYSTTLKIQNWAEAAQQMFAPIKILDDTTIISPWSEYTAAKGEKVIVINPGMAFGTGYHATTQLAARLMFEIAAEGKAFTMCDVGCGSAILSIIAAGNGIKKIDAVEIDSDAIISAKENIERNKCNDVINILDNISLANSTYDIVVANILYSTISELKDKLVKRVNKNGRLVLSGVLADEDEKLRAAYKDLKLVKKTELDGWMGYIYATVHS